MAKNKFLKVLNYRNNQAKFTRMKVVRKATAFILALGLGLGTIAPSVTYATGINPDNTVTSEEPAVDSNTPATSEESVEGTDKPVVYQADAVVLGDNENLDANKESKEALTYGVKAELKDNTITLTNDNINLKVVDQYEWF